MLLDYFENCKNYQKTFLIRYFALMREIIKNKFLEEN